MQETIAVRPGEEIDQIGLSRFLRSSGISGHIDIRQFPGGSSNLTYLIKVGNNEFVLRRPPFGNNVRTAHDMGREYRVLSKLSAAYLPAPKPLLFCEDASVIGAEFYLMERRRGRIIRGNAPQELASSATLQQDVCRSFIRNLAELHSIDYSAAGLGDLGKPEGYALRQVAGWTKRYFAAKTNEWPDLEASIEWLNTNIPAESGASLVHNDYKFDNVILDPEDMTVITAVLDWEMVTIGDPLMDLGTSLGYWMSKESGEEMLDMPFNPRILMERISRTELVEMYVSTTGRDISNILFYYVFGTIKIAAICQQIYARYLKGFTRDPRFCRFDLIVSKLGRFAAAAIETGTI